MKQIKRNIGFIIAFGLIAFGLASHAIAQGAQTAGTVRQINIKFEDFRYNLNNGLNRGSFSREDENEINEYMNDLEDAIIDFETKFQKQSESGDDALLIASKAENVGRFISRFKFDAKVLRSWSDLKAQIENLSASYGANGPARDNGSLPQNDNRYPSNNADNYRLTGTYRLDASRSDDARQIVEDATRNSGSYERNAARKHLDEKLSSPELIAIETRGKQVTIASSTSPQVTFDATGKEKFQQSNGKNIRVRADLRNDELTIEAEQEAQTSNRLRDYSYIVTFSIYDDGMKVVRRLTDDNINQTFTVTSYYAKDSDIARLDIYREQDDNNAGVWSDSNGNTSNGGNTGSNNGRNTSGAPSIGRQRTGNFIVSDGTIITGTLQDNVTTKVTQDGDRFRLRVDSPNQYRGAIIEGYISGINRSGKITGSSKLTFNFEKILLSNGQTYDFAGFLQSITDADGKPVKIDEEGTAKGKSQTKETIKRGGIGAGAGAIIGAIIGGAKGAIIGATIGGGAGAGSVIVTGKQDIELPAGSALTIQASSPIR